MDAAVQNDALVLRRPGPRPRPRLALPSSPPSRHFPRDAAAFAARRNYGLDYALVCFLLAAFLFLYRSLTKTKPGF
jgi:hypothetical protein